MKLIYIFIIHAYPLLSSFQAYNSGYNVFTLKLLLTKHTRGSKDTCSGKRYIRLDQVEWSIFMIGEDVPFTLGKTLSFI